VFVFPLFDLTTSWATWQSPARGYERVNKLNKMTHIDTWFSKHNVSLFNLIQNHPQFLARSRRLMWSPCLSVPLFCAHDCGRTHKTIVTKFCTIMSLVNVTRPIKIEWYDILTSGIRNVASKVFQNAGTKYDNSRQPKCYCKQLKFGLEISKQQSIELHLQTTWILIHKMNLRRILLSVNKCNLL